VQAPGFIHLHLHSEFSVSDGITRLPALMQACQQQAMPAVALTDQSNLFAAVKFYKAAMKAGVKPIFGADLYLRDPEYPDDVFRLTVLCQNDQGYHHLTLLISQGYQQGQYQGKPCIDFATLAKYNEGLLVLSGAQSGEVGYLLLNGHAERAKHRVRTYWQVHFPHRFYIELQRLGRTDEAHYIEQALSLANALRLPVLATNDVRFLKQSDFDAHEARICIQNGDILSDPRRKRVYTDQQYFKSSEAMQQLFADIPQAVAQSVEIAKRCNVHLRLGKSYLPNFPIPKEQTIESYFATVSRDGLVKRLAQHHIDPEQHVRYQERLDRELHVINQMGFPGYFLIVADFIQWSKDHDIPVGPGRGSGAGSLVAFVLGITDLDPIQHDLLFERFLNPERVSMPDFDIDFCMDGRDQVIEYVANKYGRESVSQIITFGTMAARAVVRDVGRVLGLGYGQVDKIAKLIPFELGMTLEKALAAEALLRARYEDEEDTRLLIDLAKKLEGVVRNAGKHAGGVVIAPSQLTDFTPVYCEPDSQQLVTQFDKDDVEAAGLVKFDFLGLRTLTIIKWALAHINARHARENKPPVDIQQIPMDDTTCFQLLKQCQTLAVFQLESRGMRDLIKRLQPDCFEDIVALVALFRPGPLQSGMVDDFIDRKHGRAPVTYLHPDLAPILQASYGVILYQEQVMQIAQVLAGYTLGSADILRRAMGKKKPEEMAEQRAIFMKGAIARDIHADTAKTIFDLMEKFAGYGFNRSHSAAYALIAYQTAWLKAHYPAEFMAAVLSSDMDNTDKVVVMIKECQALGLKIQYPDINLCDYYFTVDEQGRIVYGLGAIKGVGEAVIQMLITQRDQGVYTDLFDFCHRLDTQKCNRRVLEALIKAGAMDAFNQHRACLLHSIDNALTAAEQAKQNQANLQGDLFASQSQHSVQQTYYVEHEPLSDAERLAAEKEVLGLYVSGHPFAAYAPELACITSATLGALDASTAQATVAGLITALRQMFTKRGDRMAFITLDDGSGSIEVALFANLYAEHREQIVKDQLLIISGEVDQDTFSGGLRMRAETVLSLDDARQHYAKALRITLQSQHTSAETIVQLKQLLASQNQGSCPVTIQYQTQSATALFPLGETWQICLSESLLETLRGEFGADAVQVGY